MSHPGNRRLRRLAQDAPPKKMKKINKKFISKKKFLNRKFNHTIAYIFTELEVIVGEGYIECNPTLSIADCHNKISLEIEIHENGSAKFNNTIYKLNTLIDTLVEFKSKVIEGRAFYLQKKKELDEWRKEKLRQNKEKEKKTNN